MNLGRVVQHDPKSKLYRTRHASAPIIYADWHRYGQAFDQGEVGSCTGEAGEGVMNTQGFCGTALRTQADAVKLYSDATKIDGFGDPYPTNDRGSSGLAVAQVLKASGRISRYEHAFSLNDVLAALGRGPGMLGTNWYDSMDSPIGGYGLLEVSPNASIRGGHEVELTAVFPQARLVKGWNSWGRGWANKGTFMLSFDTLERLLAETGDYTILFK